MTNWYVSLRFLKKTLFDRFDKNCFEILTSFHEDFINFYVSPKITFTQKHNLKQFVRHLDVKGELHSKNRCQLVCIHEKTLRNEDEQKKPQVKIFSRSHFIRV